LKALNDVKPRVVVGRCIEFEPVRYNGQMMRSEFVKARCCLSQNLNSVSRGGHPPVMGG